MLSIVRVPATVSFMFQLPSRTLSCSLIMIGEHDNVHPQVVNISVHVQLFSTPVLRGTKTVSAVSVCRRRPLIRARSSRAKRIILIKIAPKNLEQL